ncbi:MAG: hypothetical protein ACE5FD_12310 [Anaerolineae bacterium]
MPAVKSVRILFLLLIFVAACRKNEANDVPIVGELDNTAVKIEISQSGFYRLTAADLTQAGMTINEFSVENLNLTTGGTAVPYLIQENALIFYGQAPTSRYTAVRPYILHSGEPGTPMTETAVPATTSPSLNTLSQTLHLEENNLYLAETYRPQKPDVWYWADLICHRWTPMHQQLCVSTCGEPPAVLKLRTIMTSI